MILSMKGERSLEKEISSKSDVPIKFCWQKTDAVGSKKLDLSIKRNLPHSKEAADSSTLESLQIELEILKESLEKIKRNV